MFKTPVSILQEFTVQKRLTVPDYQCVGSGQPHCMSFEYHVQIGNETATGTGATKKDAKQDAARNMLSIFGVKLNNESRVPQISIIPSKSSKLEGPIINYVGKLNEFCTGHKYPLPTYIDSITMENAQFAVICTLNAFKVEGYGLKKKDAKQDAAKKMFSLIRGSDLQCIPVKEDSVNKLEENNEISEQVLKKYSELIKNVNINDRKCDNNNMVMVNKEEVNLSTWAELTEFLDKLGCKYELKTFQESPLILCLTINERVLMHYGRTRDEILPKFVENVVNLIREGIDFSTPLSEL